MDYDGLGPTLQARLPEPSPNRTFETGCGLRRSAFPLGVEKDQRMSILVLKGPKELVSRRVASGIPPGMDMNVERDRSGPDRVMSREDRSDRRLDASIGA